MCVNSKKMVLGKHKSEAKWVLADTDCGTYECLECAEKIVRLHQLRIIEFFQHQTECSFLTITAHEDERGFDRSLSNLDKGMRRLFERMRRRYGTRHYVLIHERHADGISLHIHMLIACAISTRWLKDNSRACGMGYMCKAIRLRDPKAAGFYVSKYISKSVSDSDFPKRFKRVRYSQKFPKFVFEERNSDYVWSGVHKQKSEIEAIKWFASRDGVKLVVLDKLSKLD